MGVVCLLALLGGAGYGALVWFQKSLDANVEKLGDPFAEITDRPDPAPSDPEAELADVNILVLGSDSRISAGDPSQWEAGAQRTDAIMLVHLPADRKSAVVVSIPRDSWVEVPGYGQAKINAAFSYGGPSLMIQTVENLTDVRIDHFVVTDFESFTSMTDALGGVQIRVPEDIGDGDQVFFSAGVHQMSGEEALKYTRQRYGLANGDFGRVQRQQNWMRAILGKINNNRGNVVTMTKFFDTVSKSVATDDELTMDRMRELFESAREVSTNDVVFMTAPYEGTGRSADGQSIVVLDDRPFGRLMKAISQGEAAEFLEKHGEELELLPATVN
ncbi:LytR family transcriptional attenuator [Isoptericola jiangsuensis]|uniref:LytR family transcriptional attenuator n=1 Tax=Isoptericola jiangsuensis TaxID=548579 RepID=A0A2A9EZM0_9MICO|nr:LytR family transcriptional attenuator [Isoptericola jiangsuensis]